MRRSRGDGAIKTDVLVIGAGIAGCSAALVAADAGMKVTIVTRGDKLEECSTWYAQGGIAYRGKGDSKDLFKRDILKAGAGMGNPAAVEFLARHGRRAVREVLLDRLGISFDEIKGRLHVTEEGAHSLPRVIHVKDYTGRAVLGAFLRCLKKHKNVRFLPGHTAVDLITLSHHSKNKLDVYKSPTVVGAYLFRQADGAVIRALARETVLATGGIGKLYLHTTNPWSARGDGVAMAFRAGARIMNMEYIQFHPTTLYHPGSDRFLISEAVRGEGGILLDRHGRRFMEGIHPRMELAPRDVVARAIHRVMTATESECVYLDISHKPSSWIEERFPHILEECLKLGIDMRTEPIPVVPAAHYCCGGVFVDLKGRTTIAGLRAVGEVACNGLHGANRLASTSLLEGLVFGLHLGRDIASARLPFSASPSTIRPWEHRKEKIDPELLHQDWATLRRTMWNYVGLERNERRLSRAKHIVDSLSQEINAFYRSTTVHDHSIGLRHGVLCASLIIHAARLNRRSIGVHYRSDAVED